MESAEEVVLELNVSPVSEHVMKAFMKRLKYWLKERRTPIEDGDAFYIAPDILIDFGARTYYARETPTARVVSTRPKGDVWVNDDTNVIVDFKPSGPAPVTVVRISTKDTPLERHPQLSEFLLERGFTLEKYHALPERNKDWLLCAFRLWLTERGSHRTGNDV